ncbi:MAG: type II toxin-antitoxin system RelE/ParE family toxin [Nanoarchaeota archaeon]
MFEVTWEKRALQELKKLDYFISKRILKKVHELKEDPFSSDTKKLKSTKFYRLRIGTYRVLFEILDDKLIKILKVGHRKNIYKIK